ncbi:hypothetical protein KO465_03020 [Candidatus Micrarchaeota archaeon]|nr:hypothetical protein [Candidatus Micrarchaeota archaeon]
MDETYDAVNKAWKKTCKIIFGEEIGELKEYEKWLIKDIAKPSIRKSHSKKNHIAVVTQDYCSKGNFLDFSEVDFNKKFSPLNVNEIKDIDSILESIKERICYTGNIWLGNSKGVETSTAITDSHNIFNSIWVDDSKNVAYSAYVKQAEYLFGSDTIGETKYCIKTYETYRNMRSIEIWKCANTSDSIYCFGLDNCNNTMFSFNTKNKNYMIGGIQLSPDKFKQIKKDIIGQLVEELKQKKELPSLMDLLGESLKYRTKTAKISDEYKNENFDISPLDNKFKQTCKLVLGRDIGSLEEYKNHLLKRTLWPISPMNSVASGNRYYFQQYAGLHNLPKAVMVGYPEALRLGSQLSMDKEDIENLDRIKKNLWKIGYVPVDYYVGENRNFKACPASAGSQNNLFVAEAAFSKNCAYSTWPRDGENMFGVSLTFSSSFCIDTYYSKKLSRTFQVDCSENCTDAYYLHNCENVHDSMFCFNVKNLRNAIGNTALPAEEYKKIKTNILNQIADELEKKKDLKWDIYNIGCYNG